VRQGVIEVTAIKIIIMENKSQKMIFNHLFNFGFNTRAKYVIKAGIVINKAARNNFIGLFNTLFPSNKPAALSGTYSSK